MEFIIAIHALVYLLHKGGVRSSSEIAQNCDVNPVQVRRVLSQFVKAGYIGCTVGASGGYCISEKGSRLTLRDVVEILGFRFLSGNWITGSVDLECPISEGMQKFGRGLVSKMEQELRLYLVNFCINDIANELVKNYHPAVCEELSS